VTVTLSLYSIKSYYAPSGILLLICCWRVLLILTVETNSGIILGVIVFYSLIVLVYCYI
jgi:hypothetical protein